MQPNRQFSAELKFHFIEHTAPERRRWFMFGSDLHRRVPMAMDGVDGLNTVGMWSKKPATFHAGDSTIVDCTVLAPMLYAATVKPGVTFELWDGGFFATGTVLERFESGWPNENSA